MTDELFDPMCQHSSAHCPLCVVHRGLVGALGHVMGKQVHEVVCSCCVHLCVKSIISFFGVCNPFLPSFIDDDDDDML